MKPSETKQHFFQLLVVKPTAYLIIFLTALLPKTSIFAAEFTTFSDVFNRSGWIEFSSAPNYANRIFVLPEVSGPCFNGMPVAERKSKGVIIAYALNSELPVDTQLFTREVIRQVTGRKGLKRDEYQYQVSPIQPKDVTVRLLYLGDTLREKRFSGKLKSKTKSRFYIKSEDPDLMSDLLSGEFEVEIELSTTQGTFSSLDIRMSEEAISKYRIEALKEIIRTHSSKKKRFFFKTWRKETAKLIVNQKTSETGYSRSASRINILTNDANDDMLGRMEEFLGFETLTPSQLIELHKKAANNPKTPTDLAQVHLQYARSIENLNTGHDEAAKEALASALSKLGGAGKVASFLLKGIQFGDGAVRVQGTTKMLATGEIGTAREQEYQEIHITSQDVKYSLTSGPFLNQIECRKFIERRRTKELIGKEYPSAQHLGAALLDSVEQGDIGLTSRLLQQGAHVNLRDRDGNTALILSSRKCYPKIAKLLLEASANYYASNNNQKTAFDYACNSVKSIIAEHDNN